MSRYTLCSRGPVAIDETFATPEEAERERVFWKSRSLLANREDLVVVEVGAAPVDPRPCWCDEIGDEPCPRHAQENRLQDEIQRLRAKLAEFERLAGEVGEPCWKTIDGADAPELGPGWHVMSAEGAQLSIVATESLRHDPAEERRMAEAICALLNADAMAEQPPTCRSCGSRALAMATDLSDHPGVVRCQDCTEVQTV